MILLSSVIPSPQYRFGKFGPTLALLFTILVFTQTIHYQSCVIETIKQNGPLVDDADANGHAMLILIPKEPDPTPAMKIRNAVEPASITGTEFFIKNLCRATSQVRISIPHYGKETNERTTKWKMQALDESGAEKRVGGDEFYITYHDDSFRYHDKTVPENSADHPLAVAKVNDLRDGTYELDFISSPMATAMKSKARSTQSLPLTPTGGYLKVHFVYTCGIGTIAPPRKNLWKNGAYSQTSYTIHVDRDHSPPIRMFEPPERVVDLEEFDQVVFVGDSLMNQFIKHYKVHFHSNVFCSRSMGQPLHANSWKNFASQVKKDIAKAKNLVSEQLQTTGGENSNSPTKLAVVIGSSTWDILANDLDQGPTFLDHRLAMRELIETVRSNHPNVTLVWKSATPLHNHVIINKATKMFGPVEKATERVKYLSSSRSAALYGYQKEICEEMNVPFLDVYDAYDLSGDWHFPTDGRHYRPELNQVIFNWFFSKPQTISVDYRYTLY